jgi:hypothetical protein
MIEKTFLRPNKTSEKNNTKVRKPYNRKACKYRNIICYFANIYALKKQVFYLFLQQFQSIFLGEDFGNGK